MTNPMTPAKDAATARPKWKIEDCGTDEVYCGLVSVGQRGRRNVALRIRNGVVLCAAQSFEEPGDFYIDDGHHYALAEHFRKPETQEDRDWAELYGRCLETDEDPRKYWPATRDEYAEREVNRG